MSGALPMLSPLLYTRMSLRSLARNKLRSSLAILGVVIGVTAVISIVSLGEAANKMVQDQIASLGANRLMIMPGSEKSGGFHGGAGTEQTLTYDDYEAILKECPSVHRATPGVRTEAQIVYGNLNWSASVQGVNEEFCVIREWNVARGRFFAAADVRSGTKVCVLGQTVARNLFGESDPLGKTIRIKHLPFDVIGVLEKKGEAPWGGDFDDIVVAPFRTVQKKLLSINHIHQIQASARSAAEMDEANEEVVALLRRRHHLQPEEEDDFMIRNQKEIAKAAGSAGEIMTMLLGSIAGVSLLVGGIGVMNIMLVSVTERTREIGIRLAVGARGADILSQFLAEAVCLTALGGLAGIGLAQILAMSFRRFFPWPVTVAPWAAAVAFCFSAAVGIAFGLYPAWRASKLDPVEALRQV